MRALADALAALILVAPAASAQEEGILHRAAAGLRENPVDI